MVRNVNIITQDEDSQISEVMANEGSVVDPLPVLLRSDTKKGPVNFQIRSKYVY